jgi:hypothetical protein
MKRLSLVLLSLVVAAAMASPVFAKPAFVEDNVPEGKALIYMYYQDNSKDNWGPLVLAKSGPIGILVHNSYRAYLAEPGTIKLWLVNFYASELKLDVVAGQIYYVKGGHAFGGHIDFELVPSEAAKTEIAECQRLAD